MKNFRITDKSLQASFFLFFCSRKSPNKRTSNERIHLRHFIPLIYALKPMNILVTLRTYKVIPSTTLTFTHFSHSVRIPL